MAAACMSGEAPEAAKPELVQLRWLADGHDPVAFLTTQPVACEAPGSDVREREIGRLAFESPALLGGRASRMGLSCSSCHLNGRDNPDFFIAGVSGAAGTADVTLSLFSKVRGDGTVNPVAIPDIATRERQLADRSGAAFREKVRGLIVEEFDGEAPPAAVFEAVLAYLRGLDITACADPAARVAVRVADDLAAARASLRHAEDFAASGDRASAILMARVTRARLERIHERYAGLPGRDSVVAASREIETWIERVRTGEVAGSITGSLGEIGPRLEAAEAASLYAPGPLRTALAK